MIEMTEGTLVYYDHGKRIYACDHIELRIEPGEFVGILGPSGSGKSSLLYLMSGLKVPTSGTITYDGASYDRMTDKERSRLRLREFGFVFQYPYLLGYLSAIENILISRPGESLRDEAVALLSDLGLESKAHRYPHELSGGERQRVCVARALLGGPKVIFADEPTASLDHKNGEHVVSLLKTYRASGSLIIVTHDPSMLEGADRIVTIGEGKIIRVDDKPLPMRQ